MLIQTTPKLLFLSVTFIYRRILITTPLIITGSCQKCNLAIRTISDSDLRFCKYYNGSVNRFFKSFREMITRIALIIFKVMALDFYQSYLPCHYSRYWLISEIIVVYVFSQLNMDSKWDRKSRWNFLIKFRIYHVF